MHASSFPAVPITQVLPALVSHLAHTRNLVLTAEPGAGKTTRVPLAIIESSWCTGKVILLEPRRIAAQTAARYMASLRGESVGETVGYRIRGESRVGPRTKVEVVTEGVLTRMLQDDASLPGVSAVIFDEFHERSVHADLGLAFAREAQLTVRDDLRIVVMSATLHAEPVANLLNENGAPAKVLTCAGRMYPVVTHYVARERQESIEEAATRAVLNALRTDEGDILVFLPGRGEIERVRTRLEERVAEHQVQCCSLYAEAGEDAQRRALGRAPEGMRKIILATTIAETSITIDGVRVVIDSGAVRVPRYDVRRGMTELVTVPVSNASATQRAGRAGRQAPGVCYRLWGASEILAERHPPEITQADLVPLALDLAVWGTREVRDLALLDYPSEGALANARELLVALGAIDNESRCTAHGRAMAKFGTHPRWAHMILKAKEHGCGAHACELAALLEERDSGATLDVSISNRWYEWRAQRHARGARTAAHADRLLQIAGCAKESPSVAALSIGAIVAFAFPDRIGVQRGEGSRRYLLSNGGGAELPERSMLVKERYIVAPDIDGGSAHAKIRRAEGVSESELLELFSELLREVREVKWDAETKSVRVTLRTMLGHAIVKERAGEAEPHELQNALVEALAAGAFSLPDSCRDFAIRVMWARARRVANIEWPDLSEATLRSTLHEWLAPYLMGIRALREVTEQRVHEALCAVLTHDQRITLNAKVPARLELPTGTSIKIEYELASPPKIAVYLQEMFGCAETPRIEGIPLTVHLLSPAKRPLQVTNDLKSFWANSYKEVRNEMLGRYPKHYWPEDPLHAAPTSRAKRFSERSGKKST